jgi:hypothetical protein
MLISFISEAYFVGQQHPLPMSERDVTCTTKQAADRFASVRLFSAVLLFALRTMLPLLHSVSKFRNEAVTIHRNYIVAGDSATG